jgi:hypothetical protein
MKKAYKYRGGIGHLDAEGKSIFQRDIDTLVNNQIYFPTKETLNDPTEGFYDDKAITNILDAFNQYSKDVRKQYVGVLDKVASMGVYSLSNNIDNELLWAYYGGGHTGFAIEYDIDILTEALNHNQYFQQLFDFQISYTEHIPSLDISIFYQKEPTNILKTCLGTKSLSWKHEEEYRLLSNSHGYVDIDFRAVTGIYFGYKMREEEIDYIMERLKGRKIKYYQMGLIKNTYKFRPNEIEDKYINAPAPENCTNNLEYDIEKLLMPESIIGKEAYAYKDKLIEALEIVRYEPLIKKIYNTAIEMEGDKPIFIIHAYTNCEVPPIKEFRFTLANDGLLQKIK